MRHAMWIVACAALLVAARAHAQDEEERVTLAELLAHADRHAPALRVARARLAEGRAAQRAASRTSSRNPEASLSLGGRIVQDSVGFDVLAALEAPVEIGGQRSARRREAEGLSRALEASLDEVRWQVHREVHDAYHDALVARARLAAVDRLTAFTNELVAIAERRLAAGEVAQLAVRLAEADVAEARQANVIARAAYLDACLALAEASGHEPPIAPVGELDAPEPLPDDERLVAIALAHHPALRTRAAVRRQARVRLDRAESEASVTPSFGVSYGREAGGSYGPTNHVVLGTVRLELPVFERNQAARARASADIEIAAAEEDALRSTVRTRVMRAAAAVRAASERVSLYGAEILPALEQNLALVRRTFELGEIDIVLVSVARERFLRSQEAVLEAHGDYQHARSTLEAELGVEIESEQAHVEER